MNSLDAFARDKLAALEAGALRRRLTDTGRGPEAAAARGGRVLTSFSCNDYLGLSHHPRVVAAGQAALAAHGAGAGGSRLVTGNHPILTALEGRLAAHKGKEAALVFGSGYLANLGITPALASRQDLVLLDELSHACMWAGAKLSGATVVAFRHNDVADLAAKLAEHRGAHPHALVLTERVFSMDGDRAPMADILSVARDFDGLGLVEDGPRAPLEMGTLSKSLGSYGGYLCASRAIIDLLMCRARSFVYTTGLPPASAAAALEALTILEEEPERCARPLALARRFTRRLGLPEAESAVVPVIVGDAQTALDLSARLEAEGFLVVAIRPPTVPPGTARLRVAFSAAHSEAQVDGLAEAVGRLRAG
jgi:8-amino-7-oxononanoate synthase